MKILDKINKYLNEDGSEEYKAFFKEMLKKFGVSSPGELDDDKKAEFFKAVEDGWKAKGE
jgi:hypothetical protein